MLMFVNPFMILHINQVLYFSSIYICSHIWPPNKTHSSYDARDYSYASVIIWKRHHIYFRF